MPSGQGARSLVVTRSSRAGLFVVVTLALVVPAALIAESDAPIPVVEKPTSAPRTRDLAALLARARALLVAGKTSEAAGVVDEVHDALSAERPLAIRRALVVETPAQGLGKFRPARDGVVVGRVVNLYVEVERPRSSVRADGQREVTLDVTGAFRFEGEPIGERALGVHTDAFTEVPDVVAFGLDFTLSDKAPSGTYGIRLQVEDRVAKTTAERDVTLVLR